MPANLMEFFVIITQKVENPIDAMIAKDIVYDFIKSERWTIIDRDADTFLSAIELVSNLIFIYGMRLLQLL